MVREKRILAGYNLITVIDKGHRDHGEDAIDAVVDKELIGFELVYPGQFFHQHGGLGLRVIMNIFFNFVDHCLERHGGRPERVLVGG